MRRSLATALSALIAFAISSAPILVMVAGGVFIPMVYQSEFTSPALPMRHGDTWIQTFYFPDRPIEAFSLRPGTYGRRIEGTVSVWIGAVHIPDYANRSAYGREIDIDLSKLQDNRIHTFRFPSLQLEAGTRGIIRLVGTDIRNDESFTLWKNTTNAYSDGRFIVNKQIQRGDLFFKVYSRVRGLDALRMLKSRWQTGLPLFWSSVLWPVGGAFALFFSIFGCFLRLFSFRGQS